MLSLPARSGRGDAAAGWIAATLLGLATALAPLALGGTHVVAIAGLQMTMAATVGLWAVFLRPALLALAIPLGCLLLPFLQLAPLPDRVLEALAPVSAGAWKVAHAGLPNAWGRISIDPSETAAAARRAMLTTGTVAAVADLALRRRLRNLLAMAMAGSGALIWALGLAFPVELHSFLLLGRISFKGPLMPGRTPLEAPLATAAFGFPEIVHVAGQQYSADSWVVGDGFGPYLVTNHFAGALVLTVPYLVAVWLRATAGRVPDWLRWGLAAAAFAAALATIAALVQSRAGTAAFLMTVLVFAWLAAPQGKWRRNMQWATLAYTAFIVLFVVVLFGPFQGIERRLPARVQPYAASLLANDRVLATRVAERMFLASPLFGTGLGTYGDLYPVMVRDGTPWYYAHNEYAQLLAEAGLAGVAWAAVPVALLAAAAIRFGRRAGGPPCIFGAASWAAVAGIALHSCFDWNLRVPANCFLACISVGLALGSACRIETLPRSSPVRSPLDPITRAVFVLAMVVATGFLMRDAVSELVQRKLRVAVAGARLHDSDPAAAEPQRLLREAVLQGESMAKWDPGDAQLAVALGQANLHLSTTRLPIDDANACLGRAAEWFGRAQVNCASCRGIPVPHNDAASSNEK